MSELPPLPDAFASTRESLRAVACYAVSPARRARTGRIGLRPVAGGFGTPPFDDDGSRIVVHANKLARVPGDAIVLTTVRAAADFLGLEPSPDPGVGADLPPFAPDADLTVDEHSSSVLGSWYAFGQELFDAQPTGFPPGRVSEAQIWPEHFDLAVTVELESGPSVNVGFSPGDSFNRDPYVYVGPHGFAGGAGNEYWNAPFGAYLPYDRLVAAADPADSAQAFIVEGLSTVP